MAQVCEQSLCLIRTYVRAGIEMVIKDKTERYGRKLRVRKTKKKPFDETCSGRIQKKKRILRHFVGANKRDEARLVAGV